MTELDDDRSAMNDWLRGGPAARESQARLGRRLFGDPEPDPQQEPHDMTDGTTAPDRAHEETPDDR